MKRNAVGGLVVDDVRESLVTSSGAAMMNETIRVAGLGLVLSRALGPWRLARARHDPGKVLLDVAIAVALGGDCLADVAAVRAQRDLFGVVASDPTVSRLFAALAVDDATTDAAVMALRSAHAAARDRVWSRRRPLAGTPGTREGGQVIVDIDATLVAAHSDKEGAEATHKMSYGFAPMCAFVDHGEHGTGETLALDLRPERPRRSIVLITSQCWAPRWNNCPPPSGARCWCAPMPAGRLKHSCITSPTPDCTIPSGFPLTALSRPRSRRFPSRLGWLRSTVTAHLVRVRRSPSSPTGCRPRSNPPVRRPSTAPGMATRDASHRPP